MMFESFASAKVNLFLHVGPLDAAGYHPLCSLMVFADVGDKLRLDEGPPMRFAVEGAFAAGIAEEPDNLVVRARDALLAATGVTEATFGLTLHKALPIAAGLGGGSSDAAAALRLVRAALSLDIAEADMRAIAATLGSDVPACLRGLPVIATGRGEVLKDAPSLPDLDAVLVNPGVPCPTGPVFRAYDRAVAPQGAAAPAWPADLATITEVVAFLADCRNDLQAPAVALRPEIGVVLEMLAAQPETLLARMSGSGATCFALCPGGGDAERLAERLAAANSRWWVRACRLGGGP